MASQKKYPVYHTNMKGADAKKFAQEVLGAYEARLVLIGSLVQDTHKTLDDFRAKREELTRQLRENLAQHKSLRKNDFDKMMSDILLAQSHREENVKMLLAQFRKEEEEVVQNLRVLLEKGDALHLRDFRKTLTRIREWQREREQEATHQVDLELAKMKQETEDMLAAFSQERQKMSSEWEKILAMTKKQFAGAEEGAPSTTHS